MTGEFDRIATAASGIVEVDFDNVDIEPSQGSHFFHNLTSSGIPFLPVHRRQSGGRVDWAWLAAQPVRSEFMDGTIRHLRVARPVRILLDGARRRGVVAQMDPAGAA